MSIGLAIAFLAMLSFAVAMLVLPLLLQRRQAASRDAYSAAVYRDQLAEVARDLDRGLLDEAQAAAARAEIGRRILALRPRQEAATGGGSAAVVAVLAVLVLPVAAGLLYWRLGMPALPDEPLAARRAEAAVAAGNGHIDIDAALARLNAHLKTHADDLTGWLLLARSERSLGHFAAAADAYRHADALSGHRADVAADLGEALVLAADGNVTAAAKDAFEAALHDPDNAPRARYYLALARLQQGDAAGAVQAWRALAADAPADAPWLPLLRRRIAAATATPGAAETPPAAAPASAAPAPALDPAVAAAAKATEAASPAERQAMIDAMVERLAARLQQQPDDVAGWARLGHSYMVLGRPDKAGEAYARALKLKPDDAELQQALMAARAAAAGQPSR